MQAARKTAKMHHSKKGENIIYNKSVKIENQILINILFINREFQQLKKGILRKTAKVHNLKRGGNIIYNKSVKIQNLILIHILFLLGGFNKDKETF